MKIKGSQILLFVLIALSLSAWPADQSKPGVQQPRVPQTLEKFPDRHPSPFGPDLTSSIDGPANLVVYPGLVIKYTVKVYISNKGPKDVKNFDTDVVLSDNQMLQGTTRLLKRTNTALLRANTTAEIVFEKGIRIPDDTPYKPLYLGVIVDSGHSVPESKETNNAAVLPIRCQMTITSVWQYAESPEIEITLSGQGFGSSEGTKKVYLGNAPHLQCFYWTPTQIVVHAANVECFKNYAVTIQENSATLSNSYTLFVKCVVDYLAPEQGPAGTTVHVHGKGFGSQQGIKILKLGTTPVSSITSWGDQEIVCQIPSGLAPGDYAFTIWLDGEDVSLHFQTTKFTVL